MTASTAAARVRPGLLALAVLFLAFLGAGAMTAAAGAVTAARGAAADKSGGSGGPFFDPARFKGLKWREVGPYRGGRSAAVTGIPGDRATYYFGATGGGVWKTTDAGRSWHSVSDGFFGGSIGDVAVSAWDPNVVYVGTGEVTVRGNVSEGDGMWKSTDAGKSWKRAGLDDSRHITRIRIHPKNPDLVYAAVLGHLFGPSAMRGVYRSSDGGTTWKSILHVSDQAGAFDLAMDPQNPLVLYAGMWRVRRTPNSLESGGEGSGLWKTTDGGDSWSELSHNPGLPEGTLGVAGVSVSGTDPDNLYAIVEAEQGGVFRSRDGGKSWAKTSDDHALRQRAWYYSRIFADPADSESVYVANVFLQHSKDGGKSWTRIRAPHGDHHDLWIAPEDPRRMINANDGGANVSEDGGKSWTPQDNQPTAQIYRVSTDTHFPYRIYGAQQDNSALRIASRSPFGGIGRRDWTETAGGESGYVVPDPGNPDVVYGGSYGGFLVRLNHVTEESRDINVWPDNPMGWGAADLKYRFQWNFPIFFSPNDPRVLYAAAQVLFKSADEGQSWTAISRDLTRNDKSRQGPSGGPITKDNTSIEYYDTIFTAAESPVAPGVLWAGSDDGLVHVSKDGGLNWKDVTPADLPAWAQINSIEASPHAAAAAYFAATRYKLDDQNPYLYKTSDYGAHWTRIVAGIDPNHFTRVIRADPARAGLLYAGTERGLYVSLDDGARWQTLQLNLPLVPVTDLTVKEGDLVAATQGRGFWVLDDLTPLRDLAAEPRAPHALHPLDAAAPRLFAPRPAYRAFLGNGQQPPGQGENAPGGAVIYYHLREAPAKGQLKIEILAADGTVVHSYRGKPPEKPAAAPAATATQPAAGKGAETAEQKGGGKEAAAQGAEKEGAKGAEKETKGAQKEGAKEAEKGAAKEAGKGKAKGTEKEAKEAEEEEDAKAPAEAGLNRFVWDLTHTKGKGFPGMVLWTGEPFGPLAAPGKYQVRLTVGKDSRTVPLEVRKDPRSTATQEDLEAQLHFLLGIRDKLDQTHDALRRVRAIRAQVADLKQRLAAAEDGKEGEEAAPAAAPHAALLDAAKALDEKLTAVEEALYQTKNHSEQDPLNYPIRLDDKLNGVAGSAAFGDYRPTAQQIAVRDALVADVEAQLAKLGELLAKDLAAFNDLARKENVGAVIPPRPRNLALK